VWRCPEREVEEHKGKKEEHIAQVGKYPSERDANNQQGTVIEREMIFIT
jgi:uncharacterized coiled-coil DUF342 family protein